MSQYPIQLTIKQINAARLAFVFILAVIYVMRVPDLITNPQFWAEDGRYFFRDGICLGLSSLIKTYQGYYHFVPRITAFLTSFIDPFYAPMLFFGVTMLLISIVLYLVLSPRLQLPCKPLLALIVVIFPHAEEICGNITNIQWYLPIGMLCLLFMRPAAGRWILTAEVMFLLVAGLTGPFMLLLLPVIVVKGIMERKDKQLIARNMVMLAAGIFVSALQIHAIFVAGMHARGSNFGIFEMFYSKLHLMLTVTLVHLTNPFIRGIGTYMTDNMIESAKVVCIALIIAIIARAVAARSSKLLFEKGAIIYFAIVVIVVSLLKNIDIIDTYTATYGGKSLNGGRYFFIPGIMFSWLFVIMMQDKLVKYGSVMLLALLLFSSVSYYQRTPLKNYDWPKWAPKVVTESSVWIPINPQGWAINMNCSEPN